MTWVKYPGLPSSKYHELAKKYLPKGAARCSAFGIKGGHEGQKLIDTRTVVASGECR